MQVTTKFDIGDLVWFKHSTTPSVENRKISMWKEEAELGITVFRVTEHVVQTCYTTTQVFYDVRPMTVHYMLSVEETEIDGIKTKKNVKKFGGVSPGWGTDNKMSVRFREDELKFINEDLKKDILSGTVEL